MKIIQAPNIYRSLPIYDKKIIFLAGSIEMGSAEMWQDEVIDIIKYSPLHSDNTIILNPRRDNWDPSWEQTIKNSVFREQVEWELCGIEDSDLILFYFDPNTRSPITLMELGTLANVDKDKAIVCCPDGYWRKGNVEIFCELYDIPLHHTKKEFLKDLENLQWR
jgi:hypothetical protein